MHKPTYELVGCVYERGSYPVIGSLLYVGCYIIQLNILDSICKYFCDMFPISMDLLVDIIIVYVIVAIIELSILSWIKNLSGP